MNVRFPHAGEVIGAAPGHPSLIPALAFAPALSLSRQQALLDWEAIKRIPGLAGYWPAGIEYLWADDAGTTLPSIGGGIGKRLDAFGVNHATQATATFKPILRQTSASKLYWLDSNTPGSALTATLGNLGTACTVAQIDATGPYFTENVTITSTYNLTAPYGYGGDIAIFNRALTASEKALVTRYMRRSYPEYDFPVRGAPDAWWLTVDTTDVNQTWTVAIDTGTTINITVDWGDATVDTYTTTGQKTHTYATAGRWYPKITGSFSSGGNINFGKDATNRTRLKATGVVPTIPGLANFSYTFYYCTGITEIPIDIFRYNPQVSADAFNSTFVACQITTIPAGLFRYNTLVSNFFQTFYSCNLLRSMPADLFRYNTNVTNFRSVFNGCNKLQLRSDIFFRPGEESARFLNQSVNFTDAMRIGTFTGTQGTAPALWDCNFGSGTPTITDCFKGQTPASVTNFPAIPTTWGSYWMLTVDTTDVSQTWTVAIEAGTTPNITVDWGDATVDTYTTLGDKTHTYATAGRWYPKITGSFASGGNIRFGEDATNRSRLKATAIVPTIPGLANFLYTFRSCTGLTSIPVDLFRYNTGVSNNAFANTFEGCTGLTSIPVDLFRYNTAVSSSAFLGVFGNCTGLTSIPDDLFKYNAAVSSSGFAFAFDNCSGLTSVPADLFRYNTSCTSFTRVFYNCNKLQLRSDMFFRPGEEPTRFLNKSADFTNAMRIGTFTGTQGTAPALWDCSYGTGTPTTTTCFTGQTLASVTNYASIPTAWGGA